MITAVLVILALPMLLTLMLVISSFFSTDSAANKRWWRLQMLIAIDQLVNTYFKGWADESISSRAYRRSLNNCRWCPVGRRIIDAIFYWEPDHCKKSYDSEMERFQLPPEFRGD